MTPQEQAAAIIAADPQRFEDSPATVVAEATSNAAQHETGRGIYRGRTPTSPARFWTHVACALVAAADSPHVTRGAVLDGLVDKYGTGLPAGS